MGGAPLRPEDYDPRLNDFVLSLARRGAAAGLLRRRPRAATRPSTSRTSTASFSGAPRLLSSPTSGSSTARSRTCASFVLAQDVIWVGGGNTASLLAVWRMHGLDVVLREAWEQGVVLCGVSAGMNCWFEASTTDSFDLTQVAPLHGRARVPARQRLPALRRRGAAAAAVQRARGRGRVPARLRRRRRGGAGVRGDDAGGGGHRRPRARLRIASPPTARSRAGAAAVTNPSERRHRLVARVGHEHVPRRVGDHQLGPRGDRDRLGRHAARPEHRQLAVADLHGVAVVGRAEVVASRSRPGRRRGPGAPWTGPYREVIWVARIACAGRHRAHRDDQRAREAAGRGALHGSCGTSGR